MNTARAAIKCVAVVAAIVGMLIAPYAHAGVSAGISAGKSTGVTVSAAQGSGDGNGQDLSYTHTQIGGKTINLQSGGDTTLKGVVVKANTVNASVGCNLLIESLQDTSNYTEQSKNAGGSVTIGPAPGASINLGQSNIDSSYASVMEQSGIRAGDGGFNVNVQGNTDLKGGAITSTQKAIDDNKNSFQSASLTTSDIQNSASYKADSAQINAGVGSSVGGSAGIGNKEGSVASTTQAAISGVAGNKAARTGDSETGIAKIFDADAVRKDVNAQVAITKEFGQQATKVGAQYAQDQLNKANALKALAGQEADSDAKQKLLSQASDLEGNWKEGGPMRVLMHAGIGLLTGAAEGAAGAAASASTTPQISDMLADANLPDAVKQGLLQATGAAIGALAGGSAGAATGINEVSNNALGIVIKRVGVPAIVACLRIERCRAMTGVVGAALAVQAAKIMQENPGLSESDAFSLAIVDYGASVLTGKPATPLPPAAPTITPADARKIYGTPPLNDQRELSAWLGNVLDGYPADEAAKWAKEFITTLPASQQQTMSDLIMQSVQDNAVAGNRREREVTVDLQAQYPNGSVQNQQYLRDKNGDIVIDPLTNTARRLDHVVIADGKVVDVVETTSLTARKNEQIDHESNVRGNGGTFIRDRNTGKLVEVPSVSRIERRP